MTKILRCSNIVKTPVPWDHSKDRTNNALEALHRKRRVPSWKQTGNLQWNIRIDWDAGQRQEILIFPDRLVDCHTVDWLHVVDG